MTPAAVIAARYAEKIDQLGTFAYFEGAAFPKADTADLIMQAADEINAVGRAIQEAQWMKAAHRAVAAKDARIAELEKDKARLDWLEEFLRMGGTSVSCCVGGELKDDDFVYENGQLLNVFSGHYSIGYQYEMEHRGCYAWRELADKRNRLRSAIDAARAAPAVAKADNKGEGK